MIQYISKIIFQKGLDDKMSNTQENSAKEFFSYKGKPLVRCGNTIYYGNMSDKYMIMMQVLSTTKMGDLDVANKVSIQLWLTDDTISARDRIVKTSEKSGLYEAMDIASIWLERALAQ